MRISLKLYLLLIAFSAVCSFHSPTNDPKLHRKYFPTFFFVDYRRPAFEMHVSASWWEK